jgi:hypothetical protein
VRDVLAYTAPYAGRDRLIDRQMDGWMDGCARAHRGTRMYMRLRHISLYIYKYIYIYPGVSGVALALGSWHSCARVTGGAAGVACWGDASYGQLGTGNTTAQQNSPANVALGMGAARGGKLDGDSWREIEMEGGER